MNRRSIVAAAVLILSAAAPAAWAQSPEPDAAAATAEKPDKADGKAKKGAAAIPDAPVDKGQIVFFRPGKYMGMAVAFKVREGETELGTLSNGKYFVATIAPGAHSFVVHSEAKDTLNMEIEPGETYYVQGSMAMGALLYRPNLSPSSREAFEVVAPKLKLSEK